MGLLEITPAAREELTALASHPENRGKGIRIYVEGPPRGEKTCWILFEEKPRPVDRVFIEGELTIIVGPESAWYLKGKELDFDEEDGTGAFYITPIPTFECDCFDEEEWAHLDELPPEEEPWDDDEWELVADEADEDETFHRRRNEEETRHNPGRLPRGWRPAP